MSENKEKKTKFDNKYSMRRYGGISLILAAFIILGVAKAGKMMLLEKQDWDSIANKFVKDKEKEAHRGNIYGANGELMASTLPVYQLVVDFDAIYNAKNDTLYPLKRDSIAEGLHRIYPKYSKQYYLDRLDKGFAGYKDSTGVVKHSRWFQIMPKYSDQLTYEQFQEVKKLPMFRLSSYRGGLIEKDTRLSARKKPYGSLASSTIGSFRNDTGRYGLERAFNEHLAGKKGMVTTKKVLGHYLDIDVQEEEDGCNIVTTIDIEMQDMAEQALMKMLETNHSEYGCCIVMEVKTGDIKALVNLDKDTFNTDASGRHYWNGKYKEGQNHAVSDLIEPGSVFKTVSALVVLDDAKKDTTISYDTGTGVKRMYGSNMRDWSANKGLRWGVANLSLSMQQSLNTGISGIVDGIYHNDPERYVRAVYNTGIHDTLGLPFLEARNPRIRMPKRKPNGKLDQAQWHPTALPWMSIGYETQIPPISTLTFYNAIANGGKMMRPRIVQSITKGDVVVKEFPVEVMRESICRDPKALAKVQRMLELVVSQGTAKKTTASKLFPIAGKTGTALVADGSKGYKAGGVTYTASFAGYFPADNPKYSCIVVVNTKSGGGGSVGGPVFKEVAEGIMARNVAYAASDAHEKDSQKLPDVKQGNLQSACYVLDAMLVNNSKNWKEQPADIGQNLWGLVMPDAKGTGLSAQPQALADAKQVPNVCGMGARDAVYLLESRGVKTKLVGRGRIFSQSLPAGKPIAKGDICILELRP